MDGAVKRPFSIFQLAGRPQRANQTDMFYRSLFSLLIAGMACSQAELPSLEKDIWLGYYAGYESKSCFFGITAKGEINLQLIPDNKKGSESGIGASPMNLYIRIEEILPNGKTTTRIIKPESLETTVEPTHKLDKTVIRGKVTGDASFEMTVERERDSFTISNRLIDAGSLTKNEIRPVVIFAMRQLYPYDETPEVTKSKTKERAKDTLDLKWTDGTKKKFSLIEEKDATLEEFNGPGIAVARLEGGGLLRARQLTLEAPAGVSMIQVSNSTPQMLSRGLRFSSMPAPSKPGAKPNDTARLVVSVR
jgi:hypothetical protein